MRHLMSYLATLLGFPPTLSLYLQKKAGKGDKKKKKGEKDLTADR